MRKSVFAAAIVGAATVALLAYAATVSAPVEVSPGGPLVTGAVLGLPAFASDGTEWLAAWVDGRELRSGLYAARILGDGSVPSPQGRRLEGLSDPSRIISPSVAWNGTFWLVAWIRLTSNSFVGPGEIRVIRVASSGVPLDPAPRTLFQGTFSSLARPVAIASAGPGFLVAWVDSRISTNGDVYAMRLDAALTTLEPQGIRLSAVTAPDEAQLSVTTDGIDYLVGWSDSPGLVDAGLPFEISRVPTSGPPGMPVVVARGQVLNPVAGTYTLAGTGGGAMFTWNDLVDAGSFVLRSRLLFSDGGMSADFLTQPTPGEYQSFSSAAVGDRILQGWRDGAGWHAQSFLLDGGAASPDSLVAIADAGNTGNGALVGGVTEGLVTWVHGRTLGGWLPRAGIFVQRVTPAAVPLDVVPALAARRTATQWSPALSAGRDAGLVIWHEDRDTGMIVAAGRVDTEGRPFGAPIPVAPTYAVDYFDPLLANRFVATGADNAIVTWSDRINIYASRITLAGTVLDNPPLTWVSNPAIDNQGPTPVWVGGHYLVLWTRVAEGTWSWPVFSDGSVGDAGSISTNVLPIQAETNGSTVLIANDDLTRVFLVDSNGSPGGADPVLPLPDGGRAWPRIASDGTGYLLTWREQRGSFLQVRGLFVDGDGGVAPSGDSLLLANDLSRDTRHAAHSVAWDGSRYLLVWARTATDGGYDDLWAQFFDASGAPSGPSLPVSQAQEGIDYPSVQAMAPGKLVVAWSQFDTSLTSGSSRAWTALINNLPLATACTAALDCASGFCADGVCCDSACGGGTPDCQACSTAAGAVTNGHCGTAALNSVCRPAAGACDVPEVCDGVSTVCPGDQVAADGGVCMNDRFCEQGVCTPVPPEQEPIDNVPVRCGDDVVITAVATGSGPITWDISADNGITVDRNTGVIRWTPTVAQVGNHEVTVVAIAPGGIASRTFYISVSCGPDVQPPEPDAGQTPPTTGKCGCGSSPAGGLALALLAALIRRRRSHWHGLPPENRG